jgi:hypothetical protein
LLSLNLLNRLSPENEFPLKNLFQLPFSKSANKIILFVWAILAVVYGVFSAQRQVAHGDLYVFFISGVRFISGESLYAGKASGLTFMYPPFAGMVHQLLALSDLKFASGLFSGLNLIFLGVCFIFCWNWFRLRWRVSSGTIFLGWLLSGFYFFLNLELGQNNIFLLFFTLFALELWLRGKFIYAGSMLSFVIFFKLTALFLLGWMILRGNLKFLIGAGTGIVLCVILPVLFRGIDQSLQDWKEFHFYFFRYMLAGHVYTDLRNQNLAATLIRLVCEPIGKYPHAIVNFFSLPVIGVKSMIQFFQYGVIVLVSVWMIVRRIQSLPITLAEPALFLCLSQLFSGLTWNQHLVMLLPVVIIAVADFRRKISLRSSLWIIILVSGSLSAKTFLGTQIHFFAYSFGLYTWILFSSAIFLAWLIIIQEKYFLLKMPYESKHDTIQSGTDGRNSSDH